MTDRVRRSSRWFGGFVLVAAALVCAQCGSSQSGTSGTGTIGLEVVQQRWIAVENRAGQPLTDVLIEVVPYGAQTVFTSRCRRLESGEKRDFVVSDFQGRDGTPLNVRVTRPKLVKVTAKDLTGQTHTAECPW
jgi:hypothetical protein